MAIYKCKVIDDKGKLQNLKESGASVSEVRSCLFRSGCIPVTIKKQRNSTGIFNIMRRKAGSASLSIFCRQMGIMYLSGIPIAECLRILGSETEDGVLKDALSQMYDHIESGYTLSESLEQSDHVFPDMFSGMVRAGETVGCMPAVMERMSVHFSRRYKTEGKLKAALTYPAVLAAVCLIVVIFLLIEVIPQFASIYLSSDAALPLPTAVIIGISGFMISNAVSVLLGVIFIFLLACAAYNNVALKAGLHHLALRMPAIKDVCMNATMCEFAGTLSASAGSGVDITESLRMAASTAGNAYITKVTGDVISKVEGGASLSQAVESSGAFTNMMVSMLKVGESSGAIPDVMAKTADFYDAELENAINRLTSIVEPVIIIVMAVVVGFIVLAVALPMFDMVNMV